VKEVKAPLSEAFGTLADWRRSIAPAARHILHPHGIQAD
jgi:hypothetical protein